MPPRLDGKAPGRLAALPALPHGDVSGFEIAGEPGRIKQRTIIAIGRELVLNRDKRIGMARKAQRRCFISLKGIRDQLRQLRKLGPLEGLLGMMPQLGPLKGLKDVKVDENEITRVVAIIDSMTQKERVNHMIINRARRRRIAKGSGTSVQEVNQLLKHYGQAKKMMKSFSGGMLGKKLGKMKLPFM